MRSMTRETTSTTVGEHMTPVAYSVGDDQTLAEASLRMQDLDVRHLPVMRGSRLVGILSERDIAMLKARTTAHLDELRVVDAMTRDPYHVPSSTPLHEVALAMGTHRYGATLVVDDGEVRGIFSTTDGMLALARLSRPD
jgi:CBS domain-containing protein